MLFEQIKVHSERSILVYFGVSINEETHEKVQLALQLLKAAAIEGITEIVSGYTNVCIYYEPLKVRKLVAQLEGESISSKFIAYVSELLAGEFEATHHERHVVEIPVIYGGEYGPDLEFVAEASGLTVQEVIEIHTEGDYLVYMLGFTPGFPFLGGLDERIATPRKMTPRLKVEAGSVGIAGAQTGIYPLATPGGWQIIGRAMRDLFLPEETSPTLLRAGDRVKFVAVKEGDV